MGTRLLNVFNNSGVEMLGEMDTMILTCHNLTVYCYCAL